MVILPLEFDKIEFSGNPAALIDPSVNDQMGLVIIILLLIFGVP